MRLYLDDDSASSLLTRLPRTAGHDVQLPAEVGFVGADDAVHLTHAVHENRVLLSRNHRDFENLHNLIMETRGHYPGILVVRRDNDPTRDMTPRGTVRAVANLVAAGVPLLDSFYVLNHWR